jgi:hypothetical protein
VFETKEQMAHEKGIFVATGRAWVQPTPTIKQHNMQDKYRAPFLLCVLGKYKSCSILIVRWAPWQLAYME